MQLTIVSKSSHGKHRDNKKEKTENVSASSTFSHDTALFHAESF